MCKVHKPEKTKDDAQTNGEDKIEHPRANAVDKLQKIDVHMGTLGKKAESGT